ncbi:MAG: cobalt-precorrin-5B (C(1))-methyltransferase [Oscillospiraceae bacterium]|nr:cobalt-precorrin-5B (C(1))-methyltransferase [Oscillospiraceae bacterium]
MEEYIVKGGKKLRLGYTTGSCAAAAAKAAAYMLLTGRRMERVALATPKGIRLELEVKEISIGPDAVSCAIEKDSGDDPDVTRGTLVFAEVSRHEAPGVAIDGGVGVGRVTKPGLDQPVGAAAINSVPRRMILEAVEEVRALTDSREGLKVVISSGAEYVLLTPGNYGSDFIRDGLGIDPALPVQTSNFIGDALDICRELGFRGALLVGHIGKLVKLAGGMFNTHSQYGDCRMEIIAAHAAAAGLRTERVKEILQCVACDDALRILREEGLCEAALARLTERIGSHLRVRAGESMETEAILFSKVYGELSRTAGAEALLRKVVSLKG